MLGQQISPAKDEIHNTEEEMKGTERLSAPLDVFQLRNSTSGFVKTEEKKKENLIRSHWKHNFKYHLVKMPSQVQEIPKDPLDAWTSISKHNSSFS